MSTNLDETHDPRRRSWITSANEPGTDFPLQNLPFGIFRDSAAAEPGIGVAIGDQVLALGPLSRTEALDGLAAALRHALAQPTLNALMALEAPLMHGLRRRLSQWLDANLADDARQAVARCLHPMAAVEMCLPADIGDYTDFLTSAHHTERHGRLKGLADPLPQAFYALPVAYHGRASSIRVSGTELRRPHGQFRQGDAIVFGPTQALDFELELGGFVRGGNRLGQPVPVQQARDQLFGYCLLNDWSAKDVQWLEQVLGPFLGKSFLTSLSPWVVTSEALAPFRAPLDPRPPGALPVPAHLRLPAGDTLDIRMQAFLSTEQMRLAGHGPVPIASTAPRHLAWSFEQMLAHHTSNGCDLRPGDLMGSGTVSGPGDETRACMTEMTGAGRTAITLPNGEERRWLQDGDEVIFQATASKPGLVSIGFGECRGRVLPAGAGLTPPARETAG